MSSGHLSALIAVQWLHCNGKPFDSQKMENALVVADKIGVQPNDADRDGKADYHQKPTAGRVGEKEKEDRGIAACDRQRNRQEQTCSASQGVDHLRATMGQKAATGLRSVTAFRLSAPYALGARKLIPSE